MPPQGFRIGRHSERTLVHNVHGCMCRTRPSKGRGPQSTAFGRDETAPHAAGDNTRPTFRRAREGGRWSGARVHSTRRYSRARRGTVHRSAGTFLRSASAHGRECVASSPLGGVAVRGYPRYEVTTSTPFDDSSVGCQGTRAAGPVPIRIAGPWNESRRPVLDREENSDRTNRRDLHAREDGAATHLRNTRLPVTRTPTAAEIPSPSPSPTSLLPSASARPPSDAPPRSPSTVRARSSCSSAA